MSGSSLLRNAVKRITHKERAQPSNRKNLGLLEKHEDYVERATNFKNKQKYLKALRGKAVERNEDEFYFHMHNSKVVNGKHVDNKKNSLDKETVDLMKTQDLAYIIHKKQVDSKKIEKLQESIQLIGEVKPKKHIVFVDDEAQLDSFDPVQHFDTAPELVNRAHNRLRMQQLNEIVDSRQNIVPEQEQIIVGKKRKLTPQVRELKQRSKRAKKLEEAYFELSQQRNVARLKGSKKKLIVKKEVGGKEKEVVVYKWRNERSK